MKILKLNTIGKRYIKNKKMENRIEEIEKIHSMSDLLAVIEEYRYNGLFDAEIVELDLSKATIEKN